MEFRFDYYRVAAMRAGVPEMWLDDASQDIAIRLWKQGQDTSLRVRTAAVDTARRYGNRIRRSGKPKAMSLEHAFKLCPCFGEPY